MTQVTNMAQRIVDLEAALERAERKYESCKRVAATYEARAQKAEAKNEEVAWINGRLVAAEGTLKEIAHAQPKALKVIRDNGFVFDDIGKEPGNWQHLAFTLYTDICEIDTQARHALGREVGEQL